MDLKTKGAGTLVREKGTASEAKRWKPPQALERAKWQAALKGGQEAQPRADGWPTQRTARVCK